MEDNYLFHPLLTTTAAGNISMSSSTNTASAAASIATGTITSKGHENHDEFMKPFLSSISIILRLSLIIFIGIISIWANYEASKGFDVTILNDAKDSPAGKSFDLHYISNDRAARIILKTSSFIENVLYSDADGHQQTKKKQVRHVTLRFVGSNFANIVTVNETTGHEFVINISPTPAVMDSDQAIISMILQGMARVWLWNDGSRAPPWLLDGMVEYINALAGFGSIRRLGGTVRDFLEFCLREDKDPGAVAEFLDYCEGRAKGSIQRLNQALRDRWDDHTLEDALRISVEELCGSYKNTSSPHGFQSWRK